jgi:predicted RNase H-like nuclease (RuvC/YqgF family)
VDKVKEGTDGLRNILFADRRLIEEMQHNVQRMKKYDDFFQDCNKKILNNEAEIKSMEKKLTEEMNSLWNSKYVMGEKVAQFEADNANFVRLNQLLLPLLEADQ